MKSYFSDLRARIKEAYRLDIITKNPFEKFEMPRSIETERTLLDVSEIETLIKTPFPLHPQLKLAFLFVCFTGLRVSDLYALKWSDITREKDKEGNDSYNLCINPIKTQNTSGIMLKAPLTQAAIGILFEVEKAKPTEKKKSEEVFDKLPAGRSANNYLKLWSARAGLKKNISFHTGRHSFATISLTYGMDVYSVSKLLGHSHIRSTEVYAKIVDEKKRAEIKKLPLLK